MGLPNFHSQAEGVLPVLVMNTVFSLVVLKNKIKSVFQILGFYGYSLNLEEDQSDEYDCPHRRVTITRFRSGNSNWCSSSTSCSMECIVCLCGFEDDEEVSELACKHIFHRGCVEKWFGNQHWTCPLCRSMI